MNPRLNLERLSYTIAEACAVTGLSDDTIYRRHQAGVITLVKAGRRTLLLRADMDLLMASLQALPRKHDEAA